MAKIEDIWSAEDKIIKSGKKTPLEFMLAVMWNKGATAAIRLEAAKSAAPYIHKKQPMAVQHSGKVDIIPPFVPSRGAMAALDDEVGDNYDDL